MFFKTDDVKIEIQSVLKLSWESSHAYAAGRNVEALSLRIKGGADFTHAGVTRHINAGEIIYVPANYDYRIDSGAEELFVIHFKSENCGECDFEVFSPADLQYFIRKFENMYTAWTKRKPGYLYACKADMYKILEHIYIQKNEVDISEDCIDRAVEYINENYADDELSVDFLAREAGMSDTYFRKLFVKKTGRTPRKYINDIRISCARELLESGYYTVSEVSKKCGFTSPSYFSHCVKRITGKCPAEIKNI